MYRIHVSWVFIDCYQIANVNVEILHESAPLELIWVPAALPFAHIEGVPAEVGTRYS